MGRQINDPDNPYNKRVAPSGSNSSASRIKPAGAKSDVKNDVFQAASATGNTPLGSNFTFDPSNADRALRAGLQANGLDLNNPNGAAGPLLRRASDLERLFPLLAAINPGQYGNANSVEDSQKFFSGLPGNFEGLIHGGANPQDLLGKVFSSQDATSPLGQLQLYLQNNPGELANTLGAILGLNSSPYASNFMGRYLENLIANSNANAGLLNSHGGNLLGAVSEALKGIKTFQ